MTVRGLRHLYRDALLWHALRYRRDAYDHSKYLRILSSSGVEHAALSLGVAGPLLVWGRAGGTAREVAWCLGGSGLDKTGACLIQSHLDKVL